MTRKLFYFYLKIVVTWALFLVLITAFLTEESSPGILSTDLKEILGVLMIVFLFFLGNVLVSADSKYGRRRYAHQIKVLNFHSNELIKHHFQIWGEADCQELPEPFETYICLFENPVKPPCVSRERDYKIFEENYKKSKWPALFFTRGSNVKKLEDTSLFKKNLEYQKSVYHDRVFPEISHEKNFLTRATGQVVRALSKYLIIDIGPKKPCYLFVNAADEIDSLKNGKKLKQGDWVEIEAPHNYPYSARKADVQKRDYVFSGNLSLERAVDQVTRIYDITINGNKFRYVEITYIVEERGYGFSALDSAAEFKVGDWVEFKKQFKDRLYWLSLIEKVFINPRQNKK